VASIEVGRLESIAPLFCAAALIQAQNSSPDDVDHRVIETTPFKQNPEDVLRFNFDVMPPSKGDL